MRTWTHYSHTSTCLISIIKNIRVCDILCMYASSTLDHWQLLGIKVFVRVRGKTTSCMRLLIIIFIVPTRSKVGQLLLSFSKFFIVFLFVWVDAFYLICAPNFNFRSVAAHVIRVLTILTERIWKGCSDTALSQTSGVLLFKHVFLFAQLFKPIMLQSLRGCNSVIRVVN